MDDQYNYLSYVEQAERGSFLFENKLQLEPHAPLLANLEWWSVGRLSAALGGRPFLAYRIVALAAALGLFASVDRWLATAGLPPARRTVAMMLVGLGGGFAGLAWRAGALPLGEAVDLATGVFPFVELLANPHFVAGTALLSWSIWRFATATAPLEVVQGIVLGTLLGLVRPYDLVLLGTAHVGATLLVEPRTAWARRLLPLLGLAPVAAYDAWLFLGRPEFRSFGLDYEAPSWAGLVLGLGPAAALALLAAGPRDAFAARARAPLAVWAGTAILIATTRPVGFASQFLVGCGLPLLTLASLGLARWPRSVTLLAAGLLSPTAVLALGLTLAPNPRWHVPRERLALVESLRESCRPGDVLMAPPDIGLYSMGLTACRAYTAHRVEPDHATREQTMTRFYTRDDAAGRAQRLADLRITHLVLPGDPLRFWALCYWDGEYLADVVF